MTVNGERCGLMEATVGRGGGSQVEGQRFPKSSPDVCEVNLQRKKAREEEKKKRGMAPHRRRALCPPRC